MSAPLRFFPVPLALIAASCGGGSLVGPPDPTGSNDVVVVVFLDENGNGVLEPEEGARIPEVQVGLAGRTARTEKVSGRALVTGVPAGIYTVSLRDSTLPPYYQAGGPVRVAVPQPAGAGTALAVTIPIGANLPYEYMGFGDSISVGDGSSDGQGYRSLLQEDLRGYFGRGNVPNRGREGSRSVDGAARIGESLERVRPGFTLVMYGTNDWNDVVCKNAFPCYTIDSLRAIVRTCRAGHSLPFLATIPPVNPAYPQKAPPERQEWVRQMNELIRPLALEEGAVLADVHAAMMKEGDLTQLFVDHVHPNDRGYAIIADTFFRAITTPAGPPGSSTLMGVASDEDGSPSLGASRSALPAPTAGRAPHRPNDRPEPRERRP